MFFSPKLDLVIRHASHLHREQTRLDNIHTPYISHLVSVAMILARVTDDEDIVAAGLMHDSLEDVPKYTYEKLAEDCGGRVADIVKHVTEPLDANKSNIEQLPWLTRKQAYLENLRAGGVESAMVSAADKIHNTESFLYDVATEGDAFLHRFFSSLRNKLWFHEQVLAIVTEKIGEDHELTRRLALCTDDFRKLCENKDSL